VSVDEAARSLRQGHIVCFPTETFYGLAVDALNNDAVEALVQLKERDVGAAIALIVPDEASAAALTSSWPPRAQALARRHWPGPLTLVCPARAGLPSALVGPGGGVGMRVSSHPIAGSLARAFGGPITATSANPSGQPPASSVEEGRAYFGERIAVYLDGGPSVAERPSTVVSISDSGEIRIIRPGAVSEQELS
jgi:L-threonylcarbamoyladenylate synthase